LISIRARVACSFAWTRGTLGQPRNDGRQSRRNPCMETWIYLKSRFFDGNSVYMSHVIRFPTISRAITIDSRQVSASTRNRPGPFCFSRCPKSASIGSTSSDQSKDVRSRDLLCVNHTVPGSMECRPDILPGSASRNRL